MNINHFTNKTGKFLLLPVFIFIFYSCQPFYRVISGVSKPQPESTKSVIAFAKKQNLNINENKIFHLKSIKEYNAFLKKIGNKIPHYILFSKDGKIIKNNTGCFAVDVNGFDIMIEESKQNNSLKKIEDLNLNQHFLDFQINTQKEYILLLFWAKFGGSKMIKEVKRMNNQAENSKNSIEIFHMNMDIQKFWQNRNSKDVF